MAEERHDVAFIVGAALGGIAAAAATLLSAPRSGAATRADVTSRFSMVSERVSDFVGSNDDEVRKRLVVVRETTTPWMERLRRRGEAPPVEAGVAATAVPVEVSDQQRLDSSAPAGVADEPRVDPAAPAAGAVDPAAAATVPVPGAPGVEPGPDRPMDARRDSDPEVKR